MNLIKLLLKMNETENKKLFKHYLTEYKNYNQERPQFLYRIERWRFNTILRRPFHIAPWYTFNGWLLKGCIAYLAYYFLLKSKNILFKFY